MGTPLFYFSLVIAFSPTQRNLLFPSLCDGSDLFHGFPATFSYQQLQSSLGQFKMTLTQFNCWSCPLRAWARLGSEGLEKERERTASCCTLSPCALCCGSSSCAVRNGRTEQETNCFAYLTSSGSAVLCWGLAQFDPCCQCPNAGSLRANV